MIGKLLLPHEALLLTWKQGVLTIGQYVYVMKSFMLNTYHISIYHIHKYYHTLTTIDYIVISFISSPLLLSSFLFLVRIHGGRLLIELYGHHFGAFCLRDEGTLVLKHPEVGSAKGHSALHWWKSFQAGSKLQTRPILNHGELLKNACEQKSMKQMKNDKQIWTWNWTMGNLLRVLRLSVKWEVMICYYTWYTTM